MQPQKIPRGTFWVGGLAALALGIPVLALALYGLTQRLRWGPLVASLDDIFWITLIFCGLPALVAGGGVARAIAHRMAERPDLTVGRSLAAAAISMSVAGLGLAVLAAVPLSALPDNPRTWAPLGAVGLACGAVTGLAVGVLAALRQKRHVVDNPGGAA